MDSPPEGTLDRPSTMWTPPSREEMLQKLGAPAPVSDKEHDGKGGKDALGSAGSAKDKKSPVQKEGQQDPSGNAREPPSAKDGAKGVDAGKGDAEKDDGEFDLIIVGGGATGSGVALDAAARGLKVAMVERDDFSSGASSFPSFPFSLHSDKFADRSLRFLFMQVPPRSRPSSFTVVSATFRRPSSNSTTSSTSSLRRLFTSARPSSTLLLTSVTPSPSCFPSTPTGRFPTSSRSSPSHPFFTSPFHRDECIDAFPFAAAARCTTSSPERPTWSPRTPWARVRRSRRSRCSSLRVFVVPLFTTMVRFLPSLPFPLFRLRPSYRD